MITKLIFRVTRKHLVGLVCLFSFGCLSAQNVVIKGVIKDADDGEPLGYVNVVLTKPGQKTPIAGAVSNDQGAFVLSKISNGKYQIAFSFVGYTTINKLITATGKPIDLGAIIMSEDTHTLGEVQVRAQGPQMKIDVDKKTFTVDQTIAAAGASTSDLLRNIPSVDVDNSGNISLRNNSNVEVWINGKPSGLTADNRAEILEQMPAESIEKVEIITNPSAKYDPEGSAGIINLVLKKDRKAGYYGSVTAGGVYPDKGKMGYNLGVNLNMSSSKVDAYVSIGLRQRDMSGGGWVTRNNINPQTGATVSTLKEDLTNGRTMHGPFMRAGLDYHLDDKNTIGFAGFLMLGSASIPSDINYQLFDTNNDLLDQFSRNTSTSGNRHIYNIDLNYGHNFNKDGSTQILNTLSFSNNPMKSFAGHTQYDALDGLGNVTSDQDQETRGESQRVEFKSDFTQKISDKSHVEAGVDGYYTRQYTDISGTTNGIPDPTLANDFDYHQANYAAYATFTDKWGKFGAQLGLRGEYSDIWFTSDNQNYDIHYLQPFPSLYLNYTFDKDDQLQLNYTRRLNRPRGFALNPYINTTDTTSWTFGNPKLTPEYTNSLELNYLKSWDAHSLSASLYYRYTTNVMQSVAWMENGIMMNTTVNGSETETSGLELIVKDNFFRFLDLTTTFNLFYSDLHQSQFVEDNQTIVIPAQQSFSWNVKSIANMMLPADFAMQIIGNYNSPYIIAQGKNYGNYSVDFGLRKTFFKRKLMANFTIRDIFNSRHDKVKSWGSDFTQESYNYYNGRMTGITLTYNFGSNKSSKKKVRKPDQDDNNDNMMDMQ